MAGASRHPGRCILLIVLALYKAQALLCASITQIVAIRRDQSKASTGFDLAPTARTAGDCSGTVLSAASLRRIPELSERRCSMPDEE
jgi:hypothetical protein